MKAFWHILAFCMSVCPCVCVLISRCGKWTGKKPEKKKQCQFEPKIPIPRFFLEAVQLYRVPHRHRLYPSWHRCTIKAWLGILRKRVCLKIEYSQPWFIISLSSCSPSKLPFEGVWCTMVYPIFQRTPTVHLSSQGHGLKCQDGYRLTTPGRSSWDQRSACVWCWPWWQSWQRSSCSLPAGQVMAVLMGKWWWTKFLGHWILGCLILVILWTKRLGSFELN